MSKLNFAGFTEPQYTQIPDLFFDEIMTTLGAAELRVCLYVMRRTFGFRRQSSPITFDQMMHGALRPDGSRLDMGTGLGRTALREAISRLKDLGILTVEEQVSETGQSLPSLYGLTMQKLQGVSANADSEGVTKRHPPPHLPLPQSDPLHKVVISYRQTEEKRQTEDIGDFVLNADTPPCKDQTLHDVAVRIHKRHKRRKCALTVVEAKLKTIRAASNGSRSTILDEIDRAHEAMCQSEDWTKDGGAFQKSLEAWLNPSSRRWEIPPDPPLESAAPDPYANLYRGID